MKWNIYKLQNQIQDVYFNFYVWSESYHWTRCILQFVWNEHVIWGYIIGHFGPIPLNKWFSSNPKMHNSLIRNPNDVKLVTILKVFERDTTLMKTRFSFGAHIKSYPRWNIWTYGLTLRKYFDMLKFPNFHLKVHHDPSSKRKTVQHQTCSPWSKLSKE